MRPTTPPPARLARLLVALGVAALSAAYTWQFTTTASRPFGGSDFSQLWHAARLLLAGEDPYALIGPGRLVPWPNGFVYPLPAVLVAVPFAGLSEYGADAAWVALTVGLMAYALTRDGWGRLWVLASFPFLYVLGISQWTPLFVAAALMPTLAWVAVAKPTLGLMIAVYLPTERWLAWAAGGGALLTAAAFLIDPMWVAGWRAALAMPTAPILGSPDTAGAYLAPIAQPFGWLALLALFRWRRPEARLVVAMACVPHTMAGYELVLLLALVPATAWESAALAVLSWGLAISLPAVSPPTFYERILRSGEISVWTAFLPCVVLVLARPNTGPTPDWLAQLGARLRARLAPSRAIRRPSS